MVGMGMGMRVTKGIIGESEGTRFSAGYSANATELHLGAAD